MLRILYMQAMCTKSPKRNHFYMPGILSIYQLTPCFWFFVCLIDLRFILVTSLKAREKEKKFSIYCSLTPLIAETARYRPDGSQDPGIPFCSIMLGVGA